MSHTSAIQCIQILLLKTPVHHQQYYTSSQPPHQHYYVHHQQQQQQTHSHAIASFSQMPQSQHFYSHATQVQPNFNLIKFFISFRPISPQLSPPRQRRRLSPTLTFSPLPNLQATHTSPHISIQPAINRRRGRPKRYINIFFSCK